LQYQTGQYSQLLADYKKELDKLPEAAQAEVLLLAANSERQLGHSKEAGALYRQITTKYPEREEAKDAAYQQLINVYNSDPSALSAAVDQFLATNPTNERADQAKLLKARRFTNSRTTQMQRHCTASCARRSFLRGCARKRHTNLGCATSRQKILPASSKPLHITCRRSPTLRKFRLPLLSARWLTSRARITLPRLQI
jgi:tetratricopeptide (TPR) repeat protein